MFGKMKRRVVAAAFAVLLMTLWMQDTVAYYTTVGKATNVVTSGDIRFLIHETTDQGTEFPEEGVYVMPGDVVSKRVTIENDCTHPFYLRVKMTYGINAEELPDEECFKLNINQQDWTLHEGWYYYNRSLAPGETTPEVFSHVEIIGSKVDNRYIGKTLTLSVNAQAVQSEHNPLTGSETYTAQGWPAEEGQK